MCVSSSLLCRIAIHARTGRQLFGCVLLVPFVGRLTDDRTANKKTSPLTMTVAGERAVMRLWGSSLMSLIANVKQVLTILLAVLVFNLKVRLSPCADRCIRVEPRRAGHGDESARHLSHPRRRHGLRSRRITREARTRETTARLTALWRSCSPHRTDLTTSCSSVVLLSTSDLLHLLSAHASIAFTIPSFLVGRRGPLCSEVTWTAR